MSSPTGKEVILGRQPIVDTTGALVAFELLFRLPPGGDSRGRLDDLQASSHVIARVLADLGVGGSLGAFSGYVNADRSLLMSDMVELLPPQRFVLEILETTEIDPELRARILELRAQGYRIALDDVASVDDPRLQFLPLVDIVKVDLIAQGASQWEALARLIKPEGKVLLAEKVETREQFQHMLDAGYDLFQGYFFARPQLLRSRRMPSSAQQAIRLISLLEQDPDIDGVARELRRHPELVKPILRQVNSSAAGLSRKVDSIATAIALVGLRQISRLAQLMLYADGEGPPMHTDPLVQQVGMRARMMELLARQWLPDEPRIDEQAFLTGMLSRLDALLGVPLAQAVAGLPLTAGVRDALLDHAGPLGRLLGICEARERADLAALEALCGEMDGIGIEQTAQAEAAAAAWTMAHTAP